ncbi:MAG: flagellar M-ring protein FliF [Magnetococcales bacterium]|nr:flagellar M-ring protein FliF [Magnetococcales bacterium]
MAGTPNETAGESEDTSLHGMLKELPLRGKNGLIVAAVATILALTIAIWFATRPSYKTLFSGLPEEEAAQVVEQLNKMNVSYELVGGGTTIRVPGDKVYDLRLEIAKLGMLHKSNGVGFEIFDQTSLVGMTDFMQRMNFQRALQGELGRTIESIAAVQKARVHLVLPKRSLFVSEEKEASASVVVDLSRSLTPAQTDGIVHLVSSAVEGLDESLVTILDGKGNLIAGGRETLDDGRMPSDESIALQRKKEQDLERRAQDILDKALGEGKSIIRVTAELDFSRVEQQQELYDPDGQVPRSEQFTNESSRGVFGVGGVPGVQPNDANDTLVAGATGSNQTRDVERETINYEITKTVNRVLKPVGSIQRLSIAVMVDGTYRSSGNEDEPPVYQERSEKEMSNYQRLVEKAIGFDAERGDTIEVINTAFEPIAPVEESRIKFWEQPEFYLQVLMALIILSMLIFILRPMIKKLLVPEATEEDMLASTIADLERQLLAEGVGSKPAEETLGLMLPDRTAQIAQQMINDHLDEAREIIRSWITEGSEEEQQQASLE